MAFSAELFALLPAALVAGYWVDGIRARERAVRAARSECDRAAVSLLDETVVLVRARPRRAPDGRLAIHRRYRFEYTFDGNQRWPGEVELFGRSLLSARLMPGVEPGA